MPTKNSTHTVYLHDASELSSCATKQRWTHRVMHYKTPVMVA